MKKHFLFLGLLPLAALAAGRISHSAPPATPAAPAAPIQLRLSMQTQTAQPGGTLQWTPLTGAVHPGEALRCLVSIQNSGAALVQNLVVTQPVPAGLTYRAGTALGTATFSLDGKAFSARPTVPETQPDGTVRLRPAAPDTYTALRWRLDAVPAGTAQTVSFGVKVR